MPVIPSIMVETPPFSPQDKTVGGAELVDGICALRDSVNSCFVVRPGWSVGARVIVGIGAGRGQGARPCGLGCDDSQTLNFAITDARAFARFIPAHGGSAGNFACATAMAKAGQSVARRVEAGGRNQ